MDKKTHDTYLDRLARFTRRRDEWQAKIDEVEAKLAPPKKKSSKKKKSDNIDEVEE